MDAKGTLLETGMHSRLVNDSEYFKYIFKKTEKIACAVVYVLRGDTSISHSDPIVSDLEQVSRTLLDVSLSSLRRTELTVHDSAFEIAYVLMSLESKLRIAHAARFIETGLLEVFLHEIDSVHRALRKYIGGDIRNPLLSEENDRVGEERRYPARRAPASQGETAAQPRTAGGPSRRERVLEVIRTKGQASIKDIVEVVSDVSEKTVQRELNSLIKDNLVHREGERRWSKYSILQ